MTVRLVLGALMALTVVTAFYAASRSTDSASQVAQVQVVWLGLTGLLVWRVWRRDSRAWRVLQAVLGVGVFISAPVALLYPTPYFIGGAILFLTQALAVVSPPVNDHVRAARAGG